MSERIVWIEAESFEDRGGWTVDTQHVHLMGSAYLIAAGTGRPVRDAVTAVDVPAGGTYRAWVRCRNWFPSHAPGTFRLLVSDIPLPTILGAAATDEWGWVLAGEVHLDAGCVTLALHDLTGMYGRCDSIVLSGAPDYVPPETIADVRAERARLTGVSLDPRHMGDFDVVVVGGGPGGGPAALAAARMGMRTALIHDRPVLGGNGSSELGVNFNGAGSHHSNARETGIIEELGRIRAYHNHVRFSEAFETLCQGEPNLTLFLDTRVVDVEMASSSRIGRALGVHTLNGTRMSVGGRLFVDSTGDGWVGVFAGAEHRFGREARDEFGEDLAPDQADGITMSGCVMADFCGFRAVDTGAPVSYTPPDWAPRFPDPGAFGRQVRRIESGEWWLEHAGTIDDMRDGERARDELIRIGFGYWDYVKNVWPERDRARNYMLATVPIMVGRREGCRLVGDYILTQGDVQAGTVFPDRVAYGGWGLDVHHPEGIYSGTDGPFDCNPSVPIYTIPYRCLYSRNIENLFVAGRSISATHIALGTVRVQSTLATCGQAVGTAAAMCLRLGLSPRELGRECIGDLQQQLLRDDQSVPQVRNEDPGDLARRATASASSELTCSGFGRSDVQVCGAYELTTPRAVSFPTPLEGRVDSVFVHLRSERDRPSEISMGLRDAASGGGLSATQDLTTATASLAAGGEEWVEFRFDQAVRAPYAWVWLPAAGGVHWSLMTNGPRGSRRAWGMKPDGSVQTVVGGQYMAFYTAPETCDRGAHPAAGVINGVARSTDDEANMWASDPRQPLPQWVELAWDDEVTVGTAVLTFDTELNRRWHDVALVPQCVRDYHVSVRVAGDWRLVASVAGNFQRRRVHRFAPVSTKRLRVTVTATNGDASARIYEIRASGPGEQSLPGQGRSGSRRREGERRVAKSSPCGVGRH